MTDEQKAESERLYKVIADNARFFLLWHMWAAKHNISDATGQCCQLTDDFFAHLKQMELNYLEFLANSPAMTKALGPMAMMQIKTLLRIQTSSKEEIAKLIKLISEALLATKH